MEDTLLRYGFIMFSLALYPFFEIRRLWQERKEEKENREIPCDLERIFSWFESRKKR